MDVSVQFAKFAGREVNVTERQTKPRLIGKTYYSETIPVLDSNDPAVAELTAAAQKAGFELRLNFPPHGFGTRDYRLDRLNADVVKASDGKYRIGSSFSLG